MPYPDQLLCHDETVVIHSRPHWSALVGPAIRLLLILAIVTFAPASLDGFLSNFRWWAQYGQLGVDALAALVALISVVAPVVRWRSEQFVVTTRHIFFRTGVMQIREHQVQLSLIQDLETSVSLAGRALGNGMLRVFSAADQPLEFENIPHVARVHRIINELSYADRSGLSS